MRNASLLLLVLLAPLRAQPDRFGLPACAGPDQELAPKHSFVVCHSASFPPAPASASRRTGFRRDRSLSMPGATVADYRNSGLSRGHLVPARDMTHDEQALRDSFLLSDAVPQNSAMNRSSWRRLENQVRKLAVDAESVIVITGAIFAERPDRIGAGGVAVPAKLYKVILVCEAGSTRLIAVMMPNEETSERSLESFIVTVAEVESLTGLKFFPHLDL